MTNNEPEFSTYQNRKDFERQILEFMKEEQKEWLIFKLPENHTLKLLSYASMLNDLHFLIGAAGKLIETHEQYPRPEDRQFDLVVDSALWYSCIVIYGRLFTDSLDNRSRLNEKDVFDTLDENVDPFYRIHKELLEDRNSFVAHRGDNDMDNVMALVMMPRSGELSKAKIEIKTTRAYARGTEYFVAYLKLFQKVYALVEAKMQKQSDKLSKLIAAGECALTAI
jgi:hypothetical protein